MNGKIKERKCNNLKMGNVMEIVELQNIKIFRVTDESSGNYVIVIMDEGELEFYTPIEMKYSYFEKSKRKIGD